MDIEKIKQSGLLEQYVLNLCTPEEAAEVEAAAMKYPEIRKEIRNLQNTMQKYAEAQSIPPPEGLKHRITTKIDEIEQQCNEDLWLNKIRKFKALTTLATLLAIALAASTWFYYKTNDETRTQLEKVKAEFEAFKQACEQNQQTASNTHAQEIAFLKDVKTSHIHLRGTDNAPKSLAVVYWNSTNKKAKINFVNLPQPPSGKQYQLWADIDGKMVDMGTLDYQQCQEYIVDVPFMDHAESLNITLEKMGGSKAPNVEQLFVSGAI